VRHPTSDNVMNIWDTLLSIIKHLVIMMVFHVVIIVRSILLSSQ
jgi:hypothetical protein